VSTCLKYPMTAFFWMLFTGYIILTLSGAEGRPLEFLIGFTLCGMLIEMREGGEKNVNKKGKRKTTKA
jgi:hypothetical protein